MIKVNLLAKYQSEKRQEKRANLFVFVFVAREKKMEFSFVVRRTLISTIWPINIVP